MVSGSFKAEAPELKMLLMRVGFKELEVGVSGERDSFE